MPRDDAFADGSLASRPHTIMGITRFFNTSSLFSKRFIKRKYQADTWFDKTHARLQIHFHTDDTTVSRIRFDFTDRDRAVPQKGHTSLILAFGEKSVVNITAGTDTFDHSCALTLEPEMFEGLQTCAWCWYRDVKRPTTEDDSLSLWQEQFLQESFEAITAHYAGLSECLQKRADDEALTHTLSLVEDLAARFNAEPGKTLVCR